MIGDKNNLIELIKAKWEKCETENTEVFRYKLNVTGEKILDGNFNFLIQLNRDRQEKRRKPEKFETITPTFNVNEFNFNKIDNREILADVEIRETPVQFIINNSPLTKYHLLVIPDVKGNQPQVMTLKCLEIVLFLISSTNDRALRFGYNSPGALASVNHLHMHMLHVERELYVETIKLRKLTGNLHKIDDERLPVKGFCLIYEDIEIDAQKLFNLVEYCCTKIIPHNIFITKSHASDETRIFLFPRSMKKFGFDKSCTSLLNVAICELGGFISLGDEELFNTISESYVVDRFQQEILDICELVENDFINLMSGSE